MNTGNFQGCRPPPHTHTHVSFSVSSRLVLNTGHCGISDSANCFCTDLGNMNESKNSGACDISVARELPWLLDCSTDWPMHMSVKDTISRVHKTCSPFLFWFNMEGAMRQSRKRMWYHHKVTRNQWAGSLLYVWTWPKNWNVVAWDVRGFVMSLSSPYLYINCQWTSPLKWSLLQWGKIPGYFITACSNYESGTTDRSYCPCMIKNPYIGEKFLINKTAPLVGGGETSILHWHSMAELWPTCLCKVLELSVPCSAASVISDTGTTGMHLRLLKQCPAWMVTDQNCVCYGKLDPHCHHTYTWVLIKLIPWYLYLRIGAHSCNCLGTVLVVKLNGYHQLGDFQIELLVLGCK